MIDSNQSKTKLNDHTSCGKIYIYIYIYRERERFYKKVLQPVITGTSF